MKVFEAQMKAWKKQTIEAYTDKNSSAVAGVLMFDDLYAYTMDDMSTAMLDSILNKFTGDAKTSPYYLKLDGYRKARNAIQIGRMAPDFTQADTSGKPVKLSDFRGKYVLVDFWASWCGPCRAENPNVLKAYNQFHDKGFTVLGVSLDQPNGKDKWLNAIHHDHLVWTQVSDLQYWKNEVAVMYNINFIPQNFLISPDGKIIAHALTGEDLIKELQEIFK